MADNNNNNNNNNATISTPGAALAAERNKRQLQARETADALKISVSRLQSIEADDFSVFPSETYVRGHLRNYCRFLKLDEQQILALYNETQSLEEPENSIGPENDSASVSNGQKRWWIVYLVLIAFVFIWALSYWLFRTSNGEALTGEQALPDVLLSERRSDMPQSSLISLSKEQVSPISKTDTDLGSETVALENDNNVISGETLPEVVNTFSSADSLSTTEKNQDQAIVVSKLTAAELVQSIQSQEPTPEEEAELVPEGDTLQFIFADTSWIQVIDSTGAVLFKGLNKSGAQLDLNGKAPFDIIIGNVAATSLVYNGDNVELVAPRGKNALRLNLGS